MKTELKNGIHVENDGSINWYKDDVHHREDGPALISGNNGETKIWFKHGEIHRCGGPAAMRPDRHTWYNHDRIHRIDGPASIYSHGEVRWSIHGLTAAKMTVFLCALENSLDLREFWKSEFWECRKIR